jgi:cellobiose-specific phosphotransferase system component IIA
MKAIPILITLVFLFSLGTGILAQETELPAKSQVELPDPGLTPDSPFYFLETIAEDIVTFFTFGDLKKAERYAALAAERLSEVKAVVEKGKPELVEKTMERYKMQLDKSIARAEKAMAKGKDTEKIMEVITKVGKATSKHLEILADVYEKVPEQAKPAIEKAMGASVKGHEKAVEALKSKNALGEIPEKVSLPEKVPQKVREKIQIKVQQELEIEKVLESIDMSKSLRDICLEKGGTPEMCAEFPMEKFKSFKQIEDFCVEKGGPPELCSSLESKCKEFGVTTPNECFILLSVSSVRAYQGVELKTSPQRSLSEEEMEERK